MPIFEKTPKENPEGVPAPYGAGKFPTGQEQPFSRPGPVQRPMVKKPSPPKTLFEEKKDWERAKFLGKTTKDPLSIKGKMYGSYERKKMIEKEFPIRRFGTYISKGEAKTRLTEMGREAEGKERARLDGLKKYLEKGTGLKKKY